MLASLLILFTVQYALSGAGYVLGIWEGFCGKYGRSFDQQRVIITRKGFHVGTSIPKLH